jgi:hypothetical protein
MKTLMSLVAVLVGLTACSSAGPPKSHTGASAPPVASPAQSHGAAQSSGPLFAVLEGASPPNAQADTVAIVGLDGYARAKATFQPRKAPYVPMAATMPQSEAQVGTAGVYYIDGNGVVRLLKQSGASAVVATFPVTPEQHEVWYAVSRDGSRVLAGVLTLPAVAPPPPGTDWPPSVVGNWKFELDSASAGRTNTVLRHEESATPPEPIFPVAWTEAGPVAMVGAPIATQNSWRGGPLYTINDAGQPVTRIGGGDCTSAHVLPSGIVPCVTGATGQAVSIRDSSGHIIWEPSVEGFTALQLNMTPDASAITDGHHVATHTKTFVVPDGFQAQGWLDAQTIVGRQGNGFLAYIRIDSPATVHNLGFKGDFVGALQGS